MNILALAAAAAALFPGQMTTLGDGTVVVATPARTVEVQPVADGIFRVTTIPSGETLDIPASQSAILKPDVSATVFTTPQWVKVIAGSTTATVNRLNGEVSFTGADGLPLLTEAGGVDNSGDVKSVRFAAKDAGRLFGAGERGHKPVLNGDSITFYNRQNYGYGAGDPRLSQMGISVPWFVSDKGFGLLIDDYNRASAYLGADTISYTSETPKPLSYYFVNGNSGDIAGAVAGYSNLTGRQPLPPFWTLGYITSKYGYHNRQETLGAVDSLKTRGYPVDGLVLDLYWYGVETDMGRLQWDTVQFPDHKEMLDRLRKEGVNVVTISQPYVNKKGAIDNYNYLSERSMLAGDAEGNTNDVTTWVGDAGMLDVSNPRTREWLWSRYKESLQDGVAGLWGDLGEPEVHPLTIVHKNGETASQYHNVYGNEWSRIIYEGMRREFPQMRPMLMMRGGTAGLQRYGVMPWTTDVARSWAGFGPQVTLMLSSGLSGLGYMSSDIGGFAVDKAHPEDEELYVRWLQMGTFTPMLRTHAQNKPEPYHYPKMEEISKRFIRMRYEWLPYNYTLAYENAAQGLPLARPLNFRGDNPGDRYASLTDEYLWGDNVLVAPVMKQGARKRSVLFPAGTWISWNNPALRYKGGTTAVVSAPLKELPLFVRAGSFIPQYLKKIENVGQYDPSVLTVKYFPSEQKTSYTMFMDDRKSPVSLENNDYQLTTFTGVKAGGRMEVTVSSKGSYTGMPQTRTITLEVPGYGATAPSAVTVDGKAAKFDFKAGVLKVSFEADAGTTATIVAK